MKEELSPQFEQGYDLPFQSAEASAPDQPLVRAGGALLITAQDVDEQPDGRYPVWDRGVFDGLDSRLPGDALPTPPAAGSGGDAPPPPDDKLVPTPGGEPEEPRDESPSGQTGRETGAVSAARKVFDRAVRRIEEQIVDARTEANKLQERAGAVTDSPEKAAHLRDRIRDLSESLGEVATTLVEIREVSGFDERQEISWDDPELLRWLGTDIRHIPDDVYLSTGLNNLWDYGIRTVDKALLAGELNLGRVYNVGPKTIELLKQDFGEHIPKMSYPEDPDPALAAQLCPSLQHVPAVVLNPLNPVLARLRLAGHSGLSIEDVLSPSVIEGYLSETGELEALSAFALPKLRVMAQQYADAFNETKNQLAQGPEKAS